MGNEQSDGSFLPNQGNLFLIKNNEVKKILENVGISNGLAWNNDETQMYYNDTLDEKMYKFTWNKENRELSKIYSFVKYFTFKLIR